MKKRPQLVLLSFSLAMGSLASGADAPTRLVETRWAYPVAGAKLLGGPILAGSRIAVYGTDNAVHILDPETGKPQGSVSLGADLSKRFDERRKAPASRGVEDLVYAGVALGDRVVLPVYDLDKANGSSPNLVVCVNLASRKVEWRVENKAGINSGIRGDLAGKVVSFGSHDCAFHALSLETGAERWKNKIQSQFTPGRCDGKAVYLGSYQFFGAFDPATGTQRWKADIIANPEPVALNESAGLVCVSVDPPRTAPITVNGKPLGKNLPKNTEPPGAKIVALSTTDGKMRWEYPVDDIVQDMIPAKSGILASSTSRLYLLNSSGKLVWKADHGPTGYAGFGTVLSEGGSCAGLACSDGTLAAYSMERGNRLAVSSPVLSKNACVVWTGTAWVGAAKDGGLVRLEPR